MNKINANWFECKENALIFAYWECFHSKCLLKSINIDPFIIKIGLTKIVKKNLHKLLNILFSNSLILSLFPMLILYELCLSSNSTILFVIFPEGIGQEAISMQIAWNHMKNATIIGSKYKSYLQNDLVLHQNCSILIDLSCFFLFLSFTCMLGDILCLFSLKWRMEIDFCPIYLVLRGFSFTSIWFTLVS